MQEKYLELPRGIYETNHNNHCNTFRWLITFYASGFYVTPVVTEVEFVKEVCTGVSAGEKVLN